MYNIITFMQLLKLCLCIKLYTHKGIFKKERRKKGNQERREKWREEGRKRTEWASLLISGAEASGERFYFICMFTYLN